MSQKTISSLLQQIQVKPKDAQAHFELAILLEKEGDNARAMQSYERVMKLAPKAVEPYLRLATMHANIHALAKAVMIMKKAAKASPRDPKVHFTLGLYEEARSNVKSAAKHFEKALELKSDYFPAQASLAATYIYMGKSDAALDILNRLLELPEPPFRALSVFPRIARKYDQVPRAITLLENALKSNDLTDQMRADLEFSLGGLFDHQKTFDTAFSYYQKANEHKQEAYDPASYAKWNKHLRTVYSSVSLASLPSSGNEDQTPVFIVGMPRSGTSLLEQIICSHPRAAGAGELLYIQESIDRLGANFQKRYPTVMPEVPAKVIKQEAGNYLKLLRDVDSKASIVTDKMPGNFLHLGYIQQLFPKAKVIYCKREAMDNCLSNYFQNYGSGHSYSYNLAHMGHYYREHDKLMAHWKSVLDIPIMQVNYEDVVDDLRGTVEQVLEFIGLPWDDACENFYKVKRSVNTNSYDQVRQPLYKKSVARWKNYDGHLGELQNALSLGLLEI